MQATTGNTIKLTKPEPEAPTAEPTVEKVLDDSFKPSNVEASIAARRQKYSPPQPGDQLPFRQLRLRAGATPDMANLAADYHQSIGEVERRYREATGLREIDPSTVSLCELASEQDERRTGVLKGLQAAYECARHGYQLCGQLREEWQAELQVARDAIPTVEQTARNELAAIYGEHDQQMKSRVGSHPKVREARDRQRKAIEMVQTIAADRHRLTELANELAGELQLLCDHYRS